MNSPQDPGWASPGASGEERPEALPPPARPTGPQPPAQPTGWGTPQAPPSGWGTPPGQPSGWGTPQMPPGWAGQPPTAPGSPAPGTWGAAPPPGYAPGYPPAPAWRAPALQPGIVPLRPLSLGEILDGAVRAIRANPAVMFGMSAAVVTVAVVISALLTAYLSGVVAGSLSDLSTSLAPNLDPTATGDLGGQLSYAFGSAVTRPITALATTILTGLLVVSVGRSVLGRTISVREVIRSARAWWVVGFSLLSGLAVVVVVALYVGLIVLLAAEHQVGAAVAVAIVGGLGLVVALFWFGTRTLLVTPALMLEGKGFWRTVGRAWRLTRGSFWRLFGIWLLVTVLMSLLEQVVLVPFSTGAVLLGGGTVTSFGPLALQSVGEIIALTAATTYMSAVVALLYIDVRMRREGLDIELGRAASADAVAAVR